MLLDKSIEHIRSNNNLAPEDVFNVEVELKDMKSRKSVRNYSLQTQYINVYKPYFEKLKKDEKMIYDLRNNGKKTSRR